ncbi:hypothetical protein SISSUDRAFT_982950 [Sistotremastrum suecicum HHB10207 ss-3]|uniref:Uncharacterized protein n=1 Tax=Sistotremastrum suecicum HHB10207 ss-3 TaxID=1314776 RepID=A0A166FL62_9AGAM|nr:hypothetical protein SISSUDRAFT_982950 [Sistotremastrum suecicum HHB10207 ss-3]
MPPPTERESSGQSKEKRPGPQQLSAYRVVAKILSYDDVRMSGLRLPEEGLVLPPALTSPFRRPSSRIFDADSEAAPTIIAVCPGPSPNPSIEFIPEGLEKLGLCQDGTDMSWVDIDGTMSNNNSGERLTLLGRAIVELVWCGCICVMDVEEAL